MSTPLADQLRAYFDDVDRQQGAVDLDALRRSVEEGVITIELSPDKAVPPNRPTSGRRWPILIAAAAAAVVAIAVVATRDVDDVSPAEQPSPTLTVAPTVPPTVPPGPWSPELTAQVLSPAISCDISTEDGCPSVAVAPHGTLVAYDPVAATLTWYEDEPRVVSLTAELGPSALMEIGPHDVAYFHAQGNWIVAVAPSGVEITRTHGSNAGVYPTATGLVQFHSGSTSSHQCLSASAAPPIPWVDPDGNPITDTSRSFPTATATDAGIEIRLGERKWLLADEEAGRTPGRLECFDFRPRSDGGVVIVVDAWSNRDRVTVFELLPDGTIERYFIDGGAKVLPDGSMIVGHDLQLIHLTLPA